MDQTRAKDSTDSATGGAHDKSHDQVTDELRLLLDAMAVRAEEYLRRLSRDDADDAVPGAGESPPHPNHGTCGWCPVCAAVSMLRGERPEMTTRLAEQLAAFITLLRQILAEHQGNPSAPETEPEPEPEDEPAKPAKVQRIDVRRVSGRVLGKSGSGAQSGEPGC